MCYELTTILTTYVNNAYHLYLHKSLSDHLLDMRIWHQ